MMIFIMYRQNCNDKILRIVYINIYDKIIMKIVSTRLLAFVFTTNEYLPYIYLL